MADSTFLEKFENLSQKDGTQPGFRFRIHCKSCKTDWTTELVPYTGPRLLSKVFNKGADAGSDPAWEAGLKKALEEAGDLYEPHFIYCNKCCDYVCKKCWNSVRSRCLTCCAEEAKYAMDEALREAERRKRLEEEQAKCSRCGFNAKGAKFCPKCGNKITPIGQCPQCTKQVPPDAAFCPECGHKMR